MDENEILNNRYRLISSVGRGSYGEVWLAEDLQLGINVAIKMYAALDDNGITEFKNEFKSVYKLHHPNLLRPDYFDTDEGRPYLVMPYCPTSASGQAGKMSEAEIWEFIRDVAAGLAYLHANEVVHRDIKPANILREGGGAYVITDFGLSVKMRSSLRQASLRQSRGVGKTERKGTPLSEMSSGTIPYMAPELFSSKPISVKATDIWALGVSIYELATGELPFVGQGGGMQNAGAEIPDLDSSKWSDKLNDLLHRCLSKATWERPTAKDIVEYCESAISGAGMAKSKCDDVDDSVHSLDTPNKTFKGFLWCEIAVFIGLIALCVYLILPDKKYKTNEDEISSFVDNSIDLSSSGTANCYIVSEEGMYKFKPTKGNSTDSIENVESATVLWESFGTSKKPSIGDLILNCIYYNGYIYFKTNPCFRKGNAVIAAKDENGVILWSWHIWLTDRPKEQTYYNDAGTMMDRNLGATSATPGDVGCLGLLYQWGRKDPFLGSSSISRAVEAKSTISWPSPVYSNSSSGSYSISHPTTFIMEGSDRNWADDMNLIVIWRRPIVSAWNHNFKTIYDPCPHGWRVPFREFGTKPLNNSETENHTYDKVNGGMNFSGLFGSDLCIWYPISFSRKFDSGDFYYSKEYYGNWWSASPKSLVKAYKLSISSGGWVDLSDYSSMADGCPVRCIKDKDNDNERYPGFHLG